MNRISRYVYIQRAAPVIVFFLFVVCLLFLSFNKVEPYFIHGQITLLGMQLV
jgi:hypothetical protein